MSDTMYVHIPDTCDIDFFYATIVLAKDSWFSWKLSLGETLTIIVAIIAAVSAIVQYKSSKKDTWFLNVIVLPQLQPIKDFYLGLLDNLQEDKKVIAAKCEDLSDSFIEELAHLQEKRKNEINNFFDHITALVRSYDEDLGNKVSDVVMKLEDEYVRILDNYKDNTDVKERENILANEQELLSSLNSVLTKKKKNWKSQLKIWRIQFFFDRFCKHSKVGTQK